jgi:formylglycine-generating enzyme required for sulfatase activity
MGTKGVLLCSWIVIALGCGEAPQDEGPPEIGRSTIATGSVRIEDGTFTVGHTGDLARPEESERTVQLSAYEIDRRPVSNA